MVQVRQFVCASGVSCNKAIRLRYKSSSIVFDLDYAYVGVASAITTLLSRPYLDD